MEEEVFQQIKECFQEGDLESIKYIIGGETPAFIEKACATLPQQMAQTLRQLYNDRPKEQADVESIEEDESGAGEQRNRLIDIHLQQEEQQQRNESFLEFIAKANEKLIYEEHFGFPFYDLFKRILLTHGDPRPQPGTVKALHSQVQILYGELFSKNALEWIGDNYQNLSLGLREYLCAIFPRLTEKYFQFHRLYRTIKKETAQQANQEEENQGEEGEGEGEVAVQLDETLEIDEKQYLVAVSDAAEQLQTFEKNRSYNFLCFGLRKYQTYIALGPTIFGQIREREFCQLLSFLSIRFIRKIIFAIVRERHGGALVRLVEPITPQEIRRIGNEIVDQIGGQVKEHIAPLPVMEEEAEKIFLAEFQPYSYRDFIPRKAIISAKDKKQELPRHVWNTCKEYKYIWEQRVRVDHYLSKGGPRPQTDFLDYIEKKRQEYTSNPGAVWKDYLMIKFGFVGIGDKHETITAQPKKRQKLDSCRD